MATFADVKATIKKIETLVNATEIYVKNSCQQINEMMETIRKIAIMQFLVTDELESKWNEIKTKSMIRN